MKFLIGFCDYFFYRACCFYKQHPIVYADFAFGASTAVGVTHLFHILSLCVLWSILAKCECNVLYPVVTAILLMIYYDIHVYTVERYNRVAKKYKKEKHRKIKGWGVVIYIIISMLIPFVLCYLFRDEVNLYIPDWLRYFNLSDSRLNL